MPTSEKWQEVTYLRVCVTSTNEIRMRQGAIRVQAHREVKPYSSQRKCRQPSVLQIYLVHIARVLSFSHQSVANDMR